MKDELIEFMVKHDRGIVNRVHLDKIPKIDDVVYNRYYGKGVVKAIRNDNEVVVDFAGKVRIFNIKNLWKGDK